MSLFNLKNEDINVLKDLNKALSDELLLVKNKLLNLQMFHKENTLKPKITKSLSVVNEGGGIKENMKEVFDKAQIDMNKKVVEKVCLANIYEILKNTPEIINDSPYFLTIAKTYNIQMDKQMNQFRFCHFPFVLITINPPNNITWDEIRPLMKLFLEGKYITEVLYAYEQRGETENDIHGFHIHILCLRCENKYWANSYFKNIIIRRFKPLFGDNIINFNQINLKFIRPEHEERYINYIKCKIVKEEKILKHNIDIIFREKCNYENYYVVGKRFLDKEPLNIDEIENLTNMKDEIPINEVETSELLH